MPATPPHSPAWPNAHGSSKLEAPTKLFVKLKKVDSCAAAHEQQRKQRIRIGKSRITVDALRPLALVSEKLAARTNRRVSEQERRIARGCMTRCAHIGDRMRNVLPFQPAARFQQAIGGVCIDNHTGRPHARRHKRYPQRAFEVRGDSDSEDACNTTCSLHHTPSTVAAMFVDGARNRVLEEKSLTLEGPGFARCCCVG